MSNIFTEGNIVGNIIMPEDIFNSHSSKRKEWAAAELKNFIRQKHGKKFSGFVEESLSRNGSVTGTKTFFMLNDKKITYMLVEPKNSTGHEIHISKMEENLSEANAYDVLVGLGTEQNLTHNPFGGLKI